ncbi:MAG: hypothetical protein ABFD08_05735 [Syntrophomonas sp.]
MQNSIKIKDRGTVLEISYEDMIKYHGRFHIGGVAMAFKAMELGFKNLLPDGQIPDRKKVAFSSGLGEAATGVPDAVEMTTRARSRGKLVINPDLGKDIEAAVAPNGSKFYFELEYDGKRIGLALKEGLVPEEFITLSRKAINKALDQEGSERLQEVKEEMAASLMSHKAEDLFNCIYY